MPTAQRRPRSKARPPAPASGWCRANRSSPRRRPPSARATRRATGRRSGSKPPCAARRRRPGRRRGAAGAMPAEGGGGRRHAHLVARPARHRARAGAGRRRGAGGAPRAPLVPVGDRPAGGADPRRALGAAQGASATPSDSTDVIRGEETAALGLHLLGWLPVGGIVLSLGSHWKAIHVDRDGRIVSSVTSLGGELLDVVTSQTVLAGSLPRQWPTAFDDAWVDEGVHEAQRSGFARRALLRPPARAARHVDARGAPGLPDRRRHRIGDGHPAGPAIVPRRHAGPRHRAAGAGARLRGTAPGHVGGRRAGRRDPGRARRPHRHAPGAGAQRVRGVASACPSSHPPCRPPPRGHAVLARASGAPAHHEPHQSPVPRLPCSPPSPSPRRHMGDPRPNAAGPGAGGARSPSPSASTPRKTTGPLKPIWRFFGADEPNYAYMKDGQKLLAELGELGAEARSTSAPTTCSSPATARRR